MENLVKESLPYIERWPITVGFFALLALFAGLAYWVVKIVWPQHLALEEKRRADAIAATIETEERMRKWIDTTLARRGQEAAEDLDRAKELALAQQRGIVDGIGAKVDAVSKSVDDVRKSMDSVEEKVSVIHTLLRHKTALAIILTSLSLSLASASYVAYTRVFPPAQNLEADKKCPPGGCKAPEYCCEGTCCRNASALAKMGPVSSREPGIEVDDEDLYFAPSS